MRSRAASRVSVAGNYGKIELPAGLWLVLAERTVSDATGAIQQRRERASMSSIHPGELRPRSVRSSPSIQRDVIEEYNHS